MLYRMPERQKLRIATGGSLPRGSFLLHVVENELILVDGFIARQCYMANPYFSDKLP